MREHTFIPARCQPTVLEDGTEKEPEYTGTVTINALPTTERAALQEKLPPRDDPGFTRAAIEKAREFFVRCDVTRTKDGARYTSWEDLDYDGDIGLSVILESFNQVVSPRARVGNSSAPS